MEGERACCRKRRRSSCGKLKRECHAGVEEVVGKVKCKLLLGRRKIGEEMAVVGGCGCVTFKV